jgi:hypothetical protein
MEQPRYFFVLSFRMMNSRRRLLTYLLINIFVSALVTGSIIFFYDLAHRNDCNNCLSNTTTENPDSGNQQVSIVSINGAGSLEDEQVVIRNAGDEAFILTGWYLKDARGITFTFPQLTLYPGGEVHVHSTSGTDKLPDLYWNRSSPVWQAGELAALYDSQNIARAFYRIP